MINLELMQSIIERYNVVSFLSFSIIIYSINKKRLTLKLAPQFSNSIFNRTVQNKQIQMLYHYYYYY